MLPKAREIIAKCWEDPRVTNHVVNNEFCEVVAEKFEEYIEALQWCSGASDFALDGKARVGWEKIVLPLIKVSK